MSYNVIEIIRQLFKWQLLAKSKIINFKHSCLAGVGIPLK